MAHPQGSAAARELGAAGGRARATKLPREQRQAIARHAAEARWEAERRAVYNRLPRQRIAIDVYAALPTENPMTGAIWRSQDRYGRLLVIHPDTEVVWIGLKYRAIILVPSRPPK